MPTTAAAPTSRRRPAPGRAYWAVSAVVAPPIIGSAFISRSTVHDDVVVDLPSVSLALAIAAVLVAVFAREWYPIPALAIVTLCSLWARVSEVNTAGFDVATVVVLFTAALALSRRAAFVLAAVVVVAVAAPAVVLRGSAITDGSLWPLVLVVGLAISLSEAARARRAQLQALAERAERAELSRESEARRQVAEERLRIARDLHDAVAHQIAVINLHASAARDAVRDRPEAAERSLDVIGTAARDVLREISDLLGMLRSHDERAPIVDGTAETPLGFAGVAELIASMQGHGVEIALDVRGKPRELDASVDLVAFRVIKEAVTNAFKHGDGSTVHLVQTWLARSLVIDCRNEIAGAAEPSAARAGSAVSGHGLTGMAELVESVGGELVARRHDTQFRVLATLPLAATASAGGAS